MPDLVQRLDCTENTPFLCGNPSRQTKSSFLTTPWVILMWNYSTLHSTYQGNYRTFPCFFASRLDTKTCQSCSREVFGVGKCRLIEQKTALSLRMLLNHTVHKRTRQMEKPNSKIVKNLECARRSLGVIGFDLICLELRAQISECGFAVPGLSSVPVTRSRLLVVQGCNRASSRKRPQSLQSPLCSPD